MIRIEIIQTDCDFTVIVGDQFSDHLGRDEALGVVAAALFENVGSPPYIRSYQAWDHWNKRYMNNPAAAVPIALLEDLRVTKQRGAA